MRECAITTIDNPWDPFDDWDDWYRYDMDHHYSTCSYLARITNTSDALSDEENNEEIERAIDEIIKYDFQGIYKKVVRDIKEDDESRAAS